ncbi:MAG: DUF1176 domain-containing protein [Pseudomonadota bacterium]
MIALLALATAAVHPGELKTFRDWTVGCDNGRTCQAVSLMPEVPDDDSATMIVKRGPGANAIPEISLVPQNDGAAIVAADGKRSGIRLVVKSGDVTILPADALKMIATVTTAQRIEVLDAKGKRIANISPAGASAALRYIDDQQKRVGTVTALVAKGASTVVPPAPALPIIIAPKVPKLLPAPYRAAEARKFAGDTDCGTDTSVFKPEAHRIDATHTLVLAPTPCDNGAYNYFSVALIAGNRGTPLVKARFDASTGMGGPDDPEPSLVNAEWDEKSRLLKTYAKGRGIGDCGSTQSFAWDGTRFRLAEQADMGECRGSTDYITTWRAVVR